MALNNIDGELFKSELGEYSVLNAASWGISIGESRRLVEYLLPLCKPKVIILPVYYGDFDHQYGKSTDWQLFQDYLNEKSGFKTYLRTLDLLYYINTYYSRDLMKKKGNLIYQSLNFDNSGSVTLDCLNFEISPSRWDGYKQYTDFNMIAVQENFVELKNIQSLAILQKSKLIIIKTPMRSVAEGFRGKTDEKYLWNSVTTLLNQQGDTLVDARTYHNFSESQFVDFAHLNRCGASELTGMIVPIIRNFHH